MKSILITMVLMSTAAFANNGGSGQLVVIPKGHSKPVPYEVAVAWETGKYRNFFKLPCMPGVTETRKEFNRNYGCHALTWLEIVKDLSPYLYGGLISVAQRTHFNIIDNYIRWQEKPYPEGEIDYKKFEKAAFFNGEIILSTPVMDRVGPLAQVLTAEQNQGYIVLHELINALYPNADVKWKLDLGEVFIQKLIFKQSREEAMLNLALINLSYISGEKDLTTLTNVLKELKEVKPDLKNMYQVDAMLFTIEHYLSTGMNFKEAYLSYLNFKKVKSVNQLKEAHKQFKGSLISSGLAEFNESVFDLEFIFLIGEKYNIQIQEIYKNNIFNSDIFEPYAQMKQKEIIFKNLKENIQALNTMNSYEFMEFSLNLIQALERHERDPSRSSIIDKIRDILGKGETYIQLNQWCSYFGWDGWKLGRFVEKNLEELKAVTIKEFQTVLAMRKIDYTKTFNFIRWNYFMRRDDDNKNYVSVPPVKEGDKIYLHLYKEVFLLKSMRQNRKGELTMVLQGTTKLKIEYRDNIGLGAVMLGDL